MGQPNKIFSYILAISLISGSQPSFGQTTTSPDDDVKLGTVWFKDKSAKLTKEAKAVLDSFLKRIQSNPTMQVKTVFSNKDFCSKCDIRNWKRSTSIFKYLSRHGVSERRLEFTNTVKEESNKVDIFFTASVSDSPHPNIKKRIN